MDEEVEVDNDESVICKVEQYRAIDIHRRRQIHIMGQGSKRRVLNQTETLKRRNDEGSLILDTSGGFLNDDSEREEGSKASVNSPFCTISLTIASEPEGSLPLLPLLGKLGGVGSQLQW